MSAEDSPLSSTQIATWDKVWDYLLQPYLDKADCGEENVTTNASSYSFVEPSDPSKKEQERKSKKPPR